MPRQYEAIRDRLKSEGASEKEAKSRAARLFNAQARKQNKPSLNEYVKMEGGAYVRKRKKKRGKG